MLLQHSLDEFLCHLHCCLVSYAFSLLSYFLDVLLHIERVLHVASERLICESYHATLLLWGRVRLVGLVAVQGRRGTRILAHGHNLVQQDPRVVASRKDAVDILIGQRLQMGEACPCVSVTESKLAVFVAPTDVDVPRLGHDHGVV